MASSDIGKRYYQKYRDLTPEQRERAGSKAEFSAKKKELGLKGINVEKDTKTRMAGDALNEMRTRGKEGVEEGNNYNQGTVDSMNQQVYGVENINDFDASASGRGSLNNENRLSKADIKGLRKEGGFNRKQILQYVEDNPDVASDGQAAQNLLNRYKDKIADKQAKKEDKEPDQPVQETASTPVAEQGGPQAIGDNSNAAGPQNAETATGGGTQQTQIAGDNNTVTNNQAIDNSRTYGGSTRTFNYQSSGNPATDTPVSAATMGGFYDVDDSPAANAARVDRQVDQNRQNQQYYKESTSGIAQRAIDNAAKNAYIDPAALDKRVSAGAQNMFDMSTVMGANIFGDMFANGAPQWKSPKPAKPVEQPNFNVDNFTNF
jgi:hypothetical protein